MVNPVPGFEVSTGFHARGDRWSCNKNTAGEGLHTGVDIKAPEGTRVVAARPGVTAHVDYGAASFGPKQLAVRCDDGTEDFYAHMSSRVGAGIVVAAGDRIGAVGEEGNVTGPHLHFERHHEKGFWSCTNAIDPQPSLGFMGDIDVPLTEQEIDQIAIRSAEMVWNRFKLRTGPGGQTLVSLQDGLEAILKNAVE